MEVKKMFERAGDSVSKFAKSVGDNSKKAATKLKLNRNIHDLEKVKETAYTEMGKQYFLSHADAAEEPYAEWVQKIVEADQQIAAFKKEIAALDDLRICSACGAEMAEGMKFRRSSQKKQRPNLFRKRKWKFCPQKKPKQKIHQTSRLNRNHHKKSRRRSTKKIGNGFFHLIGKGSDCLA